MISIFREFKSLKVSWKIENTPDRVFARKGKLTMNSRPSRFREQQPNQPATTRDDLVRNPIATRRIVSLTPDTRVDHVHAATFRNYTEHWIRVHNLYNCDCGRQIGYAFQETIRDQPPRISEEVISIHSTPPASVNLNISALSEEAAAAIVIDDSTDSSDLLEERVGYVEPEPEENIQSSECSSSAANANSSESYDEPMGEAS